MKYHIRWVVLLLTTVVLVHTTMIIRISATVFSDISQIGGAYTDAVESMVEKGILAGFPDGSFRPQETLTREQAAKIIVYMLLGSVEADKQSCIEKPFYDVEIERWSAPYITWCCDRGIINGYGDGFFGPTDKLTGIQFAKMLLCAFYGEANGRYTGQGWAESVEEDGLKVGLFMGDWEMCSHQFLQRQQAALMAFNAEEKNGTFSKEELYPVHGEQGSVLIDEGQVPNHLADNQEHESSTETPSPVLPTDETDDSETGSDQPPQPAPLDPFEGEEG